MSYPLDTLLDLLDLERIEHNLYRGQNRDIGSGRIYGGQVLAQALVAAGRTLDEGQSVRRPHSLHAYFILAGDLAAPVVYQAERLRDGGSFSTRRVTAIQHGRAIFNLSASFHRDEEGLEHQAASIPHVPKPDELASERELALRTLEEIPERVRGLYTSERPIDIRPVDPGNRFEPQARPPISYYWMRANGPMPDAETPQGSLAHHAALAYASDYGLLVTALRPHGLSYFSTPGLMLASLDHGLWIHHPVDLDQWHLFAIDAPITRGARAFTQARVFTQDGTLVATVAQEGLLRVR
jgi:acyl-CoA thioesterase-2